MCGEASIFSLVKKFTAPVPPCPLLSKSQMSQMSSWGEFFSLFFFFLEGSSGGLSRDSSSDLLMSTMEQRGELVSDQEENARKVDLDLSE